MREIKDKKGITLITLVVTIIILVILALVAIFAINKYNIVANAEKATNIYSKEEYNEAIIINGYKDTMNNDTLNTSNGNTNSGNTQENGSNTNNTEGNNIAFKINGTQYFAETGMTWYTWCKSSYNTGEWKCDSSSGIIYRGTGTPSTGGYVTVCVDKSGDVRGSTKIQNNVDYDVIIELPRDNFSS